MRKLLIILGVAIILIFLATPYAKRAYDNWGRKLTYPSDSKVSKFPGQGKITQPFSEQYFFEPKLVGRPFFETPDRITGYNSDDFIITKIESQDQLLYMVGTFAGWENIEATLDKYILIKNPQTGTVERWRLAFESSDLYKDEETTVAVEKARTNVIGDQKVLISLGYESVKNIFKLDDVVILIPVFDPPELSKIDQFGNYLASKVIVRRANGKI